MAASRRNLLCACVVALACARASFADTGDLDALSLEQLMDMNVHSVLGASKYEQRVTQAPSSISIVTAEDIRRFGYANLADVLSGVRGLYVTNDRNYSYLGVRGFLRPGDYTTRVLVLIDGHRINDNVYDAGSIGREAMVDVELIDRVEVIRGPSSSVYGSSAFLGVINVITKHGRDIDGTEVGVDLASRDTYRTRATYGETFANGVDFLISGSHYSSAGWNFYYPEFDQRSSDNRFAANNGIAAGLDDESAAKFFTSVRYGDFNASLSYNNRRKQVPTASFDNIFGDPGERTRDGSSYIELGYQHAFGSTTDLKVRGFYDLLTYEGTYANDYALAGEPRDRVVFVDEATGRRAGTELQLTARPNDRYTLVVGGDYQQNLRQNQTAYDDIEPRYYYLQRDDKSDVVGLFAQAEARLRDDFTVTAGVRYDHYGAPLQSTVNPRLALIYNPSEVSAVKLLYGEAFRAPNPYERFYNVAQADAPALEPETIKTYELVYERYFNSQYRLSLSGYSYDIDGLITQVEEAQNMQFFANLDSVRARGVELELEATYLNGAILRGSWAVQRAEDEASGLELTNSPHQLAKLTGSMPLFNTSVFANLDLQYNSRTVTLARNHAPSFVVANLTLNTHELWSGVELTAGIYNILDEERRFPGAEEHAQDTLQQEGRTYGGRFIVKF